MAIKSTEQNIKIVCAVFDHGSFGDFETIERATGLSLSELVLLKPKIEAFLRQRDPDIHLTSRMDLTPPGWHLD